MIIANPKQNLQLSLWLQTCTWYTSPSWIPLKFQLLDNDYGKETSPCSIVKLFSRLTTWSCPSLGCNKMVVWTLKGQHYPIFSKVLSKWTFIKISNFHSSEFYEFSFQYFQVACTIIDDINVFWYRFWFRSKSFCWWVNI
jgi:hypothetical protein